MISMSQSLKHLSAILLLLSVTACSGVFNVPDGAPSTKVNFAKVPNATPKPLPKSVYGNPKSYEVNGVTYHVKNNAIGFTERGIASWYGTKFHGHLTSTREPYNMFKMTAAMRTVPIPCFVEVTNLKNNRRVIVKVNDRGPFADNRIIDLSYVAAGKLDMLKKGTALVEIKVLNPNHWTKAKEQRVLQGKPILRNPGHPMLYIQVGAFADKTNAQRELTKLHRSVLQKSRIERVNVKHKTLYRVQIGPLKNVTISDIVTKRLLQLGYKHSMALIE